MIQIKPISDLRNKFSDIEQVVKNGEPVFLTKNGYGSMVVLSLEEYSRLVSNYDNALVEADIAAQKDSTRMTRDEVYGKIKEHINKTWFTGEW